MDLEQIWKNAGTDKTIYKDINVTVLSRLHSNNPIKKMEQNLRINIGWGIAVCIIYAIIIYKVNLWQIQLIFCLLLGFSVALIAAAFKMLRKLADSDLTSDNLLAKLQEHYEKIQLWLKTQQKTAVAFYPVSITGGFLLGGCSGSGKSVEYFMSKPAVWIILGICWIVLTPACIWLVRKMNYISFGKYLEVIKNNINELKAQ